MTSCPLCGFPAENAKKLYLVRSYAILECGKCGHRWLNPVPSRSGGMDFIGDAELYDNPSLRFLHRSLFITPEIRLVRKLSGPGELELLDIGCGTGWPLSCWRKSGFRVTGVELSRYRSGICREKYDIDVFTGGIEDFKPEKKFDVITMHHIIEHTRDPMRILEKTRQLLTENGIISITVPNSDSLGRYIFGKHFNWIIPWHLHFFRPHTLEACIKNAGLRILRLYQLPSALGYPESFMNALDKKREPDFPVTKTAKMFLMGLFLPVALAGWAFGLGDNLTVIARNAMPKQ